jgi:hypothetical protein
MCHCTTTVAIADATAETRILLHVTPVENDVHDASATHINKQYLESIILMR